MQNKWLLLQFSLLGFVCLVIVTTDGIQAKPGDLGIDFDLQGFVDKAIQAGRHPVIIPPGRYRVTPRHRQHLILKDLADINIVAKGVEMICTETTRALTISNCRNVTLRGLTIDYDPLPYTQGRIVKLSENNTVHDIELFEGYPGSDQVQNFKYEIFRPDTRTLRFGSYHEFRVVEKEANRIRVTRRGRYHGEKVGDIIAIGTKYAPGGQIPHAIYTTRSQNVVLEDITLYASNCFGFLETNCERTTYLRCRIDRRAAFAGYDGCECLAFRPYHRGGTGLHGPPAHAQTLYGRLAASDLRGGH